MELMIQADETQQTQPFVKGTRYLIRIRKQDGYAPFTSEYYLRTIFRNLRRTGLEETSIVLMSLARHLLLFTSHIHPEDADAIRSEWAIFPHIEMFPIVEDVEQGNPYKRVVFVGTYSNRKTARLPKVAGRLPNYRWVVFEKVGGAKEGLLISQEPPTNSEVAPEAYLITASDEEDSIYYTDLIGYSTWFSVPLFHSCL